MTVAWQQRLERHALLIILLAASLFALPLFIYLSPTLDAGDLLFYKLALTEFSSQFWNGQLYPRWLYGVNDGMGSPVFIFLGPGAYYPTVLLQWLSGIDPEGNIRFTLSVLAARMLAGWLCFRWLCGHYSKLHALLITVLFLTIPYTIHEIYVRTELAGQWAFSCMFIVFIALDRLIEKKQVMSSFALVSCASCAHILIHLPTFVTFGWLPFLYVIFLSPASQRMRHLLQVFAATLCAVALSAFYVLPLWLNKGFINSEHYFSGQYSFMANYLAHPNEFYCVPYFLFAVCAAIFFWRTDIKAKKLFWLQVASILIVFFMVLPVSAFVWKMLLPLQFLQFPFRFLNVALLPFALISAYLILQTRLRALVVVLWVVGAVFQGYIIYAYAPHDETGILRTIPEHKLITLKEYRTVWQEDYTSVLKNIVTGHYKQEPAVMMDPDAAGIIKIIPSSPSVIQAAVTMLKPGQVLFHQFYFPGMQIQDLRSGVVYDAIAYGKEGKLAALLPAGEFVLQAKLGWLQGEQAGGAISFGALVMLFASLVAARKRERV